MTLDPQAILHKILEKEAAPSLSPLAVRLLELASADDSSAGDLAKVIEASPGLTSRLLSLCNSAAFRPAGGGQVSSVQRAVVIMGMREVRIMALSISLRDTLPVKEGGPDYRLFWRASLHRAALARQLAGRVPDLPGEDAFAAGLLLELGLPLLLKVLTPEELEDFPGMGAPLARQLEWERRVLGLDHRQVGEKVLKVWGLPAGLAACQAVLSRDQAAKAAPLVRACDFSRRTVEAFFSPSGKLDEVQALAGEWFGLGHDQVGELMAQAVGYVSETAEALGIELDTGADLLEVMEKANAALRRLVSRVEPAMEKAGEFFADAGPGDQAASQVREKAMVDAIEAVAHEIRNPLMSVGGFARRLAKQASDEERTRTYAQLIVDQASRLDHALAEMTSLVEPYQPKFTSLDLGALLADLPQDPPLEMSPPPGPLTVKADPGGLKQAIGHLAAYAGHLLEPGGRLRLDLGGRKGRAALRLAGPGSLSGPDEGELGAKHFGPEMDLVKARRIIAAHQGELTLEPGPQGGGFVITLTLDRA